MYYPQDLGHNVVRIRFVVRQGYLYSSSSMQYAVLNAVKSSISSFICLLAFADQCSKATSNTQNRSGCDVLLLFTDAL